MSIAFHRREEIRGILAGRRSANEPAWVSEDPIGAADRQRAREFATRRLLLAPEPGETLTVDLAAVVWALHEIVRSDHDFAVRAAVRRTHRRLTVLLQSHERKIELECENRGARRARWPGCDPMAVMVGDDSVELRLDLDESETGDGGHCMLVVAADDCRLPELEGQPVGLSDPSFL